MQYTIVVFVVIFFLIIPERECWCDRGLMHCGCWVNALWYIYVELSALKPVKSVFSPVKKGKCVIFYFFFSFFFFFFLQDGPSPTY